MNISWFDILLLFGIWCIVVAGIARFLIVRAQKNNSVVHGGVLVLHIVGVPLGLVCIFFGAISFFLPISETELKGTRDLALKGCTYKDEYNTKERIRGYIKDGVISLYEYDKINTEESLCNTAKEKEQNRAAKKEILREIKNIGKGKQ